MRLHWNLAGIHFNALRAFRRSNKFCAKLCYANMDWSRINIICRAPSQMTKNNFYYIAMFLFVLYTFSQHFKTKLKYLMEFSWISANFLVTTTKYFHLQIFPAKTYQNPFVNTFSPDPDKEHGKHSHILRYLPKFPRRGRISEEEEDNFIYL